MQHDLQVRRTVLREALLPFLITDIIGLVCEYAKQCKLLLIGGKSHVDNDVSILCYDPAANTWTTIGSLPSPRSCCAATILHGQLHVCGGIVQPHHHHLHQALNLTTGVWTQPSDLGSRPGPHAVDFAFTVQEKLFLFNHRRVVCFSSGDWETRDGMPVEATTGALLGGFIYFLSNLNLNMRLHRYDPASDAWTDRTPPNGRQGWLSAASDCSPQLFMCGGYSNKGRMLATCERYSPDSDHWVPIASMMGGRAYGSAAFLDDRLVVCGGCFSTQNDTAEAYNPTLDTWTPVAPMPHPRFYAAAVVAPL